MSSPKLIDIGKEIQEEITASEVHKKELDKQKAIIREKITHLENKLKSHELKSGMLDKIIAGTYRELENLKENEFTRRGQKQSVLLKQLESLSILHDTILKYEDMIQKYHKIIIDLENNKFNSYIKLESLKKEEAKTEEGIQELLVSLQNQLNANKDENNSSLLIEIEQELKENNY